MKEEAYNEYLHLETERWGGKARRPRKRWAIRKMRRLRRLRNSGIPIVLPQTGGEVVTKVQNGKATNRAVLIGSSWRD